MASAADLAYSLHQGGGTPAGAPPLLLIHGAGGHRLSWPPQARRLAGLDVYAVDLPGHGESGGRPETTISGYAERVLDWLRSLDVPPLIVVGHSMGGAIALTLALRRPGRVAGLALIATSGRLRVAGQILTDSASRARFPAAVDWYLARAFAPTTSAELVDRVRETALEAGHRVFHADFKACDQFDVRARLKEIERPALVISAREDRLTPVKLGQALAADLPQGTFVELQNAGHMVPLERPQEVADRLTAFAAAVGNS